MILDRQRFVDVLSVHSTAVGNKIHDASYMIKFAVDREAKTLMTTTTDFQAFLVVDFGDLSLADFDNVPDVFLIRFKELFEIVRASTTEGVEIVQQDENHVIVKTNGAYRFRLYGKPDEFPTASFSHTPVAKFDAEKLRDLWSQVCVAVSRDVTKVSYQGVLFDGNFAATDNRRLAVVQTENDVGAEHLLVTNFGDVLRECKGEITMGVSDAGNQMIVSCSEVGLLAAVRMLDAKFQPYKRILGMKDPAVSFVVPREDLVGALDRLNVFTDKVHKHLQFKIMGTEDGLELHLDCDNQDGGSEIIEATDFDIHNLDADPVGVLLEMDYQMDNFIDGVGATIEDEVRIDLHTDGKLWIEEGPFTYFLTRITATN